MDRRRGYIMVVDTETTNCMLNGKFDASNALVYDCGWQIIDKHGNVYLQRSFVNADVFFARKEDMKSAYFANKIPNYLRDIKNKDRIVLDTEEIRKVMLEDIQEWHVHAVSAHNASFDVQVLNNTIKMATKGKRKYWFPYGTEIWDTKKMAAQVVAPKKTYIKWCTENGYLTKTGQPRIAAEVLYRFISHNNDFIESHTGLEDVIIESEILAYCMRQHKKMEKRLYAR